MSISEVTRRNIVDALTLESVSWSGRLGEVEFLSRVFDLKELASADSRFKDAARDIWQHRVNNNDWDDDWVFYDSRFNLLHGDDDVFLRFICEMVHPIVCADESAVAHLVELLNTYLSADGWELVARTRISGQPVYAARKRLVGSGFPIEAAKAVAQSVDADYMTQQITRMEAAVEDDPALAIGTAKEFVETVCKTILTQRGVPYEEEGKFSKLVRLTLKELKLAPDDVSNQAKASDTIRVLLNSLATISNGLAELRNPYGTGHGKVAGAKGLGPRHAKLAVGAASTLAVFLFETNNEPSK